MPRVYLNKDQARMSLWSNSPGIVDSQTKDYLYLGWMEITWWQYHQIGLKRWWGSNWGWVSTWLILSVILQLADPIVWYRRLFVMWIFFLISWLIIEVFRLAQDRRAERRR
jgi:hypothetical protein